jgi:hypothetical protein
MLKASAILDTLVDGCEKGTFVLRLTRPDGTSRTWWMSHPEENALDDPALELVLPNAAELTDLSPPLLVPGKLPGLWANGEIEAKMVADFFRGSKVVQVDRGGYQEPLHIPKASQPVLDKAISMAVESGTLWLLSGPASILGEPIPAGILNDTSKLCSPPAVVAAAEILPENLPGAWKGGSASGLSIATSMSVKAGKTLPWKTVRDVIHSALQARFLELTPDSQTWPCDLSAAQFAKFKVGSGTATGGSAASGGADGESKILVAAAELEPAQVQELGDVMPKLLAIKAKTNVPVRFHVRIEMGDGKTLPPTEAVDQANILLKNVKDDFGLQ